MSLRVLHVIDFLPRENGGMPAAVVRLAVAQVAAGLRPAIACRDEKELKQHVDWWASQVPGLGGIDVIPCGLWPSEMSRLVKVFDVAHVHGVWLPLPTIACWRCEHSTVPTVLAPHGMLSTWSLQHKQSKKSLALALGWRRLIEDVNVLHALNADEARELRQRFPKTRIEIIPNGVFLSEFDSNQAPGLARDIIPGFGSNRRYVLFLARLHIMKGPDRLVDAFSTIAERHPDLDLVLAGSDFGMRQSLEHQIAARGLGSRIHLPGAVYGEDKIRLLRNALCVCQPSRHEGFSVTLLEALACGVPVVTTRTANFPEIETAGAGIIAAPDAQSLGRAIADLVERPDVRANQSVAARRLVATAYTWEAVERRARAVYEMAIAREMGAP